MDSPKDLAGWGGLSATWPLSVSRVLVDIYSPQVMPAGSFWNFMHMAGESNRLHKSYSLQFATSSLSGEGIAFAGLKSGAELSMGLFGWSGLAQPINYLVGGGIQKHVVELMRGAWNVTPQGLSQKFDRIRNMWDG